MEKSTVVFLAISIIAAGSLIGVFLKMEGGFGPNNLKVYGLTLVVSIGALLAVSEVTGESLTVCFSLLSAFAGYLFGIGNSQNKKPES